MVSKFNSRAGNTVTLVVEKNRLHRLKSTSRAHALKMFDMVACLIAREIGFFLTDKANEVQTLKLQVYECANCTNLQPVTLQSNRNNSQIIMFLMYVLISKETQNKGYM